MNTTPTLAWGAATDYFNPITITLRTSLPSLSAFWMVVVVCLEWHLMAWMDGTFACEPQENIWDTRYSKSVIKYTGLNRTMACIVSSGNSPKLTQQPFKNVTLSRYPPLLFSFSVRLCRVRWDDMLSAQPTWPKTDGYYDYLWLLMTIRRSELIIFCPSQKLARL